MKTLLILTVLASPGELARTTTQWFTTPAECENHLVLVQAKVGYVNGTCVELVKPYSAGLVAPND